MGQTALQFSQNLLEMLEKYKKEPYVFLTKVNQILIKFYNFNQILQYIRSLKRQYGPNCIAIQSEFAINVGKIQKGTLCVSYKG